MKQKLNKILPIVYLAIIATLYVMIEFGFFNADVTCILEYSAICCNLAFGIGFLLLNFKKEKIFLTVGLLFTLLADSGLVMYLYPNYQLVGMCFFSVTQISYFLYSFYTCKDSKVNSINVISRIAAVVITCVVIMCINKDPVLVVSAFYFVNLICNIVFAFISFKNNKLFAIGLALFIMCDIFVAFGSGADMGILNASEDSFVYNAFLYPPFNVAWFFYIPSQALITLSITDLVK